MKIIQLIFFLIINNLFVLKYCSRITPYYLFCALAYTIFVICFYLLITKKDSLLEKINFKNTYIITILIGVIGIILLLYKIDPYAVHVDRWSAIHNFIQNLFSGIYPYAAKTHLGGYGSPFPIWQFFHIPFYLLGDIGFAALFSFVLTSILLVWLFNSYKTAFIFIAFLMISPSFWYEISVRSDLIYNFLFCFLAICILYKKGLNINSNFLIIGLTCGLFLSTRVTIIIPFAIFLFSSFIKASLKAKSIFVLTSLLVLIISFLPFVFWDSETLFFFKYNPFILQTRQGSIFELLFVGSISLFLALKWANIQKYFFFTSICILLMIVSSFLHRMIPNNFENSLFSLSYDITYFNMALPFIIFILSKATIYPTDSNQENIVTLNKNIKKASY